MLHGFPIHRMVFPGKVTDKELANMAGNTLHVQIVAVAMKFTIGLVDWSKPMASRPAACRAVLKLLLKCAAMAARHRSLPRDRRLQRHFKACHCQL